MPYLKVKKLRKYMGVQDDLAVVAAARALESAGLRARSVSEGLGERAGLYLAVGYIPFEQADLDPLLAASLDADGNFSMEAFSTAGYRTVNGLLTFRCLPNMPAFHVSTNFDIQGPYFVTYPGPGQFYVALEEAVIAVHEKDIDLALLGGVAHQRNFLVESHFRRIEPPLPAARLLDVAGCLVLERRSRAAARGVLERARLVSYFSRYSPHAPFEEPLPSLESFFLHHTPRQFIPEGMSTASLAVLLSRTAAEGRRGMWFHNVNCRDGSKGHSKWLVRA